MRLGFEDLAFVDPDLDADHAERGVRFGKSVIDVRAERLQRNGALVILLAARDLSAVETAGNHHLYALDARTHRAADRLLHRAAERHTLFELLRDAFRYELGVRVGLSYLRHVDDDVFALRELGEILFDDLDLGARLADQNAGLARVNGNDDPVRSPFDGDPADGSAVIFIFDEFADIVILFQIFAEILFIGIPLGVPALDYADSQTVRINFLSHFTFSA